MIKIDMGDLRGASALVGKRDNVLSCVHLDICERGYRVVATDSTQLGCFSRGEDVGDIVKSWNIPTDEIKMIPTKVKIIAVDENLKWVPCTNYGVPEEDLEKSSRYIQTDDREYPDWEKIMDIESESVESITLSNDLLINFCNALKKAYGKGIKLDFTFTGKNNPVVVSRFFNDRKFKGLILPCIRR